MAGITFNTHLYPPPQMLKKVSYYERWKWKICFGIPKSLLSVGRGLAKFVNEAVQLVLMKLGLSTVDTCLHVTGLQSLDLWESVSDCNLINWLMGWGFFIDLPIYLLRLSNHWTLADDRYAKEGFVLIGSATRFVNKKYIRVECTWVCACFPLYFDN